MSSGQQPTRLITGYVPLLSLTGVGIACFAILSAVTWFHFFRKGQRYMLVLCISLVCMTAGFLIRIPLTNQPGSLGIYIGQFMFILLSPCGFLAQDYVLLPRLATWLDAEDCLFLRSRIIVRLFVWADVITFLVQSGGGGMTAMQNLANIGKWIAIVGLVVQGACFVVFTLLTIIFGMKVRSRYPQKWSSGGQKLSWRKDWRSIYWALIWTCVGILIRCLFRIAEFAEGYDGKLRTQEVWFYVLDTLPLVLAVAVWMFIWPPTIMNEPRVPDEYPMGSDTGLVDAYGQHQSDGVYPGMNTPARLNESKENWSQR